VRGIASIALSGMVLTGACTGAPESSGLPVFNSKDLTAVWGNDGDTAHFIAPFTLIDQTGERFGSKDLDGKIYVASFIYTSCAGICPPMVSNLLTVQEAVRDLADVVLVSFTVTPESDDAETLGHFGEMRGIVPGKWHLLTGNRDVIYGLARDSYFAERNPDANADGFLHTETLVLVDFEGRIRGVYNGTREMDIRALLEDVQLLREEETSSSDRGGRNVRPIS
jgi:protein SCO1